MAGVSAALRRSYFDGEGECWRVRPAVRELLAWAQHSVTAATLPVPRGSQDVISART